MKTAIILPNAYSGITFVQFCALVQQKNEIVSLCKCNAYILERLRTKRRTPHELRTNDIE